MSFVFGTDGLRGTIGQEPWTFSGLNMLALAVMGWMRRHDLDCVVLGRDTRLSGEKITGLLTQVLAASGYEVIDLGVLPTPVMSWWMRFSGHAFGIMVTASHNPASDNGLKFLTSQGRKWTSEEQARFLEGLGSGDWRWDASFAECQQVDALTPYLQALASQGPSSWPARSWVLDVAHGAASGWWPNWLRAHGQRVLAVNDAPNGQNINQDAACLAPERLASLVKQQGADLGMAVDGDGDRLLLVDDQARVWDGDALLSLMVDLEAKQGIFHPGVVLSEASNGGLEQHFRDHGLDIGRVSVGDRAIAESLTARGWVLGSEPSGHLLDLRWNWVGDPFYWMMRLLNGLGDRPLSTFNPPAAFPSASVNLKDVHLDLEHLRDYARRLSPSARWVIRYSGTESLLRVRIEHPTLCDLDLLLQQFVRFCSFGIE